MLQTKFHRTALGLAADLGDVGIVSALLAVDGVDVNAGADVRRGRCCVWRMCRAAAHLYLVRVGGQQGLGSPLVLACIKGRAAVVALLLERADVDVNQLSVRGSRREPGVCGLRTQASLTSGGWLWSLHRAAQQSAAAHGSAAAGARRDGGAAAAR